MDSELTDYNAQADEVDETVAQVPFDDRGRWRGMGRAGGADSTFQHTQTALIWVADTDDYFSTSITAVTGARGESNLSH